MRSQSGLRWSRSKTGYGVCPGVCGKGDLLQRTDVGICPYRVSQNGNHTKCAKSLCHRRGEQCSPGLTPLPCRASPLKRRRFEKVSFYRGGGTKCRRSNTPTGKPCSPGLTPLPCRASPLKRRRFEKASSLEEVARSAGGVITLASRRLD